MPWPNKQQLLSAYPGLSSQDDPNNPQNMGMDPFSKMLVATPTPQQPLESNAQAAAGNSQNADPLQNIPVSQNQDPNASVMAYLSQGAINPEIQKQIESNIGESKKGLEQFTDYQNALRGAPMQTDLSPTMALADYLSGSQLAKSYKAPQSGEDRIKSLSDLGKTSLDEREKLTNSLVKLASGKNAMSQLGAMSKAANLDFRERNSAQQQYNNLQKPNVQRLEGAARINDIWKGIDSGKIKSNEAAKSLILSEIQRLETGSSNPAFEGQQQKEMATNAQALGEILQKWTGKPQDSVPKPVLDQLKNLSSSLGNEYMSAADSTADVLKQGMTPTQLSVINQKHQGLVNTYKKRFGYWGEPKADNKYVPGYEEGGYRFNGGDPSDQKNWEKKK